MPNFYQILNIPTSATKNQVKAAYKKLALKYHPDKNPNDRQNAKEMFTKISEAYATLSDDKKKAEYDSILFRPSKKAPQYQWKNPEFSPEFDHFKGMHNMKTRTPSSYNFEKMPQFNFPPSIFSAFDCRFGEFTFQMADEIFQKVFSERSPVHQLPPNMENLQLNSIDQFPAFHKTSSMPGPREKNPYQPGNSTLTEQKTIQRNGKMILIRKYSVNENGKLNKYTYQTVL